MILCGASAKELEALLDRLVPRPRRPKRWLGQYRTPASIAVHMLWRLAVADKLPAIVYDLGSGTGVLSYAAACLGAGYVVGVEVDADSAADAASSPLHRILPNVDFVVADVRTPPLRRTRHGLSVMNPPFGSRHAMRGVDMVFVEAGCRLTGWVISIHDAHSINLEAIASGRCGGPCRVIGEALFPIPSMYRGHRKKLHYIRVAIIECSAEER